MCSIKSKYECLWTGIYEYFASIHGFMKTCSVSEEPLKAIKGSETKEEQPSTESEKGRKRNGQDRERIEKLSSE